MPYNIHHYRWFVDTLIPRLHQAGNLVIQPAAKTPPRIWWRDGDRLIDCTGDAGKLASLMLSSQLVEEIAAQDTGHNPNLYQKVCQGARHFTEDATAQRRNEEVCYDHVITRPTLIYSGGQYVFPPHGLSRAHSTLSTVKAGLADLPLDEARARYQWFAERLQLDASNSAKLLGWYVGLLLRPCFRPMPALLLRSPYKGTGKSCAARLGVYMATDEPVDTSMAWKGDSEFNKALPGLEPAFPVIWYDNIDATGEPLVSETINQACQNGAITARILGKSRVASVASPSIILTMQGGQIGGDLLDRLLIVSLEKPPPAKILPEDNLQLFAYRKFRWFRAVLFRLIMETQPLDPKFSWPKPTKFRYPEFYQYVAPVIEAAGLDPLDLLMVSESHESRSEYQELFKFLARESQRRPNQWFTPDELVALIPRWGYPSLAAVCSESLDMLARITALRNLLKLAPPVSNSEHVTYHLLSQHDGRPGHRLAYRVQTDAKE